MSDNNTAPADINIEDLIDDSGSDDKKIIPTLEETPNQIEKYISQNVGFKCTECTLILSGIFDINFHIETQHNKSDDFIKTTFMDDVSNAVRSHMIFPYLYCLTFIFKLNKLIFQISGKSRFGGPACSQKI